MRSVLTVILLFFSCISITISETVEQVTLEEIRQQFLEHINDYRQDRGLEKLELRYSYIAQMHASNQAEQDKYLAHKGFNQRADLIMDYLKQESELKSKNFGFLSVAENCCYFPMCMDPAIKAFQQFISSPSHRRNLLKRYEYTSIGIDQSQSGCYYFCQLFF